MRERGGIMLFVTGTKRSGTSMWMQVLRAAGLPIIGTEFPRDWGDVIREANPGGFFESPLRMGVNFTTNPNPKTGKYLHPADTTHQVVKVFIPGLIRSDLAFVRRVVGTMRPWREYAASLTRLYTLEREQRERPEGLAPPTYVAPELEWWAENYSLIGDHLRRRYPLHLVAYDEVLAEPERVIPETIGWLGVGDSELALAAIHKEYRTQQQVEWEAHAAITPDLASLFDELYQRVRERAGLDEEFVDRLNAANAVLRPVIRAEMEVADKAMRERRSERARHLREQAGGPASGE
jgi:hypothetical protein